jgi:hypothetical protein
VGESRTMHCFAVGFELNPVVAKTEVDIPVMDGVEAVVYPNSLDVDDWETMGDEYDLPSDMEPWLWAQVLLRKLGASLTQNYVESTNLAVGVRGPHVDHHKIACARIERDVDIVSCRECSL